MVQLPHIQYNAKFKLSHIAMPVLRQQAVQHDEVVHCFHNIGVLAVERHYRGKMKVRNLFKICS